MGGTPNTTMPDSLRPEATAVRLVAARDALGLKSSEMADQLAVDRSAWVKYEKAVRQLPLHVAYEACEAFGLTMDYLYRGRMDLIEESLRAKIRKSQTKRPG
jgi:transcriptional regulator with XRE-family HTH domain